MKNINLLVTGLLTAFFASSLAFAQTPDAATPPVSPGMETGAPADLNPPGTNPHTGEGPGAITKQDKKAAKKSKHKKAAPASDKETK
jgi:hypothetical protein